MQKTVEDWEPGVRSGAKVTNDVAHIRLTNNNKKTNVHVAKQTTV